MKLDAPEFIDIEDVLEIHALQIARYGGIEGVRDRGLKDAAAEALRRIVYSR